MFFTPRHAHFPDLCLLARLRMPHLRTNHRVRINKRSCLALAHSFLCSFLVTSRGEQHGGNPLTLGSSVARTKQGSFPRPGLCCPSNSNGTMNPSDSSYGLRRFRFLIRRSRWPPHRRNGSPALGNKSSSTCRPCYPGSRWMPLPLFQHPSNGLPLLTTGSASPIRLRGYV